MKTGVITQIYTSGYNWQHFFENSKGNVYVSEEKYPAKDRTLLMLIDNSVGKIFLDQEI